MPLTALGTEYTYAAEHVCTVDQQRDLPVWVSPAGTKGTKVLDSTVR